MGTLLFQKQNQFQDYTRNDHVNAPPIPLIKDIGNLKTIRHFDDSLTQPSGELFSNPQYLFGF